MDFPWKKKENNVEEKTKKQTVRVSRLTVKLLDGSVLSWTIKPYFGKGIIAPWYSFYKWYMFRKSDSYTMVYKNGANVIRRDQIQTFQIRITEEIME